MMTIFGLGASTCTRKVLMTMAETNTPFELSPVDFAKGEHKKQPHLSRQPFGRIPVLRDEAFELFESRAICRYLARKANHDLLPTDAKALGEVERWISIETSEFSGHAMKYIYEYTFGRAQAEGVIEAAGQALDTTCAVMDAKLATSPFLAGETFTLADLFFMPYIEYAMHTPAKEVFSKHPHFISWWTRVSGRPTWQKAIGKAS